MSTQPRREAPEHPGPSAKVRWSWWELPPLYLFALVAPWSIWAGNLAAGSILGLALIRLLTPSRRRLLPPRSIIVLVFVYVGIHALATAFAGSYPHHWDKWVEEMWLKFLILAVPVLLVPHLQHAARIIRVLLWSAALVAVYATFQHFTGRDLWRGATLEPLGDWYFAVGFFSHHLSYGGQVLVLLILAMAGLLAVVARISVGSIPSLAVTALLAAALLWSYARSAWIGAAAGLVTLIVLQGGIARRVGIIGIVTLLALLAALPTTRTRFATFGPQETRRNLWRSTVQGIIDRPLLGYGPGNFGHLLQEHEVEGYYDTSAHAHNDFLMHGSNAGLLGVGAALALLIGVTAYLWTRRHVQPEVSWIVAGCIAAQVALAVAGLFQVYQTDDEVEMVLYFALGVAVLLAQRPHVQSAHSAHCDEA